MTQWIFSMFEESQFYLFLKDKLKGMLDFKFSLRDIDELEIMKNGINEMEISKPKLKKIHKKREISLDKKRNKGLF